MLVLIAIGFVAGLITSISPCILPVLPIVLAAGVRRQPTRRSCQYADTGGRACSCDYRRTGDYPRTCDYACECAGQIRDHDS